MSALLIIILFVALSLAAYTNNRPPDPTTRNVVNVLLIIGFVLALLRLLGTI